MKPANTHTAASIGKLGVVVLAGTLAVVATVACSSKSKLAVTTSERNGASLRSEAVATAAPAMTPVATTSKTPQPEKPPASKLIVYRSRDYAVSLVYPKQYAFLNAKAVANGDPSLRPIPDGNDGQFTLARVEIPQGFYPESNYESGYFTLSLNQDLEEAECKPVLGTGEDGKVQTDTINGVEFRWMEVDSGGRGNAARLRQYVTFTNGTCYELELGVKTRNEHGLAREVNPDQVLRRLDGILRTVRVVPASEKPGVAVAEGSNSSAPPVSQPQN